jgi:hypothetical protein
MLKLNGESCKNPPEALNRIWDRVARERSENEESSELWVVFGALYSRNRAVII